MTKKTAEPLSGEELDRITGGTEAKLTAEGNTSSTEAAVPFHRVINNTIYGGATAAKGQDGNDLLIVNNGDGSD